MSGEGTLHLSSNRGRYEVRDAQEGPFLDLTSGDRCEVLLGGRWIAGSVELGRVYSIEELPHKQVKGYYFISDDGARCGLCEGMKVRLP